jgi:hypothetical protein
VGGDAGYREFHRAAIERRFARKKLEIANDRFELNPGKSDIVRFLNEHVAKASSIYLHLHVAAHPSPRASS